MEIFKKSAITFAIILYAIAVPYLEINDTHVFNPDWTPHVRIHEVWQLITNSAIGLFCFWLVWRENKINLAALLSLFIMGGFLLAFLMKGMYGGSMKYLDGSEKTLLGVNIGVLGFGVATALIVLSFVLDKLKPDPSQ